MINEEIKKRFEERKTINEQTQCWFFSTVTPGKRAMIKWKGTRQYVHRISWEIKNGPIESDKIIRHKCSNEACVNPEHMEIIKAKVKARKENYKIYLKNRTKILEESLRHRFFSSFEMIPFHTCWEWTGSKVGGYGVLTGPDHKAYKAHRLSWEYHYGKIPDGLLVCHVCDNRGCCNPKHLFLGTNKDNTTDCYNKKRNCFGSKNHLSKLTEADVIAIRKDPRMYKDIGKSYGVNLQNVYNIKARRTWKQLE